MKFHISDAVIAEVLKLEAIETGKRGNYTIVDERLDKMRYRVADLVMSSLMREVNKIRKVQKIK